MTIPDALLPLILALAAYRVWHLLGRDTILARPRERLPEGAAGFIECPWCSGLYCSGLVYGVWLLDNQWVEAGITILAISAIVGLIGEWS